MYAHLPFQYPGYMPQMHQDPMYPLNVGAIPEQPARQQARPAGPQPPVKSTGPPGSMLMPDYDSYAGLPGFPPRLPGHYGGYAPGMPMGYGGYPMMQGMGMHPLQQLYYGQASLDDSVEAEPQAEAYSADAQPERRPSAMKSSPGYGQGVRFSQPEGAFAGQALVPGSFRYPAHRRAYSSHSNTPATSTATSPTQSAFGHHATGSYFPQYADSASYSSDPYNMQQDFGRALETAAADGSAQARMQAPMHDHSQGAAGRRGRSWYGSRGT